VDFEPGHFFHFVVFRVQNEAEDRPEKLRLLDRFGLGESEQQEIFSKLARVNNRCFFASPGFTLAMTRLTRELEQPGIMSQTSVIALSRLVLCELVRSLDSLEIRNNKRNSVTMQRIVKFVAELGARCPEPWTLDSMASACGLGRTRFESLIKELTGDGPSYLLSRLRVRQSLVFLKNSDKSITDIAFDCGFTTSQYFAQVFKRLVGMTPSEYRRGGRNLAAYDEHFLKALARLRTEHSNGNGPKRSLRPALAV
jgi:AraC-like DNA-binding protein